MATSFEPEKAFKVEVINEFANIVYGRLFNYISKKVDFKDQENHLILLLGHVEKLTNIDLFEKSNEELFEIEEQYKAINQYIDKLEEGVV